MKAERIFTIVAAVLLTIVGGYSLTAHFHAKAAPSPVVLPAGAQMAPADLVSDFDRVQVLDARLLKLCRTRGSLSVQEIAICESVFGNTFRSRVLAGFNYDPNLKAFVPIPTQPAEQAAQSPANKK